MARGRLRQCQGEQSQDHVQPAPGGYPPIYVYPMLKSDLQARVLMQLEEDKTTVIVISAQISDLLLHGLQDSDSESIHPGGITIECQDVRLHPRETFHDRLLRATWDDLSPPPLTAPRGKENPPEGWTMTSPTSKRIQTRESI